MGFTLDELLDATGINEMTGRQLEKKAAEVTFSKLADRCRKALESSPDDSEKSVSNELVEKTAAIEIIRRTLAEIREIEGSPPETEKTAEAGVDRAAFIKAAMDAGHSPEQIAAFLEKNAFLARAGRALRGMHADRLYQRGKKLEGRAGAAMGSSQKHWTDVLRQSQGLSDKDKSAVLRKIQRSVSDDDAKALLTAADVKGFNHLPEYRRLFPRGAAEKPLASFSAGGKKFDVSSEGAKRVLKPAAMVGAGAVGMRALSGGGKSEDGSSKRRGNVTIIN